MAGATNRLPRVRQTKRHARHVLARAVRRTEGGMRSAATSLGPTVSEVPDVTFGVYSLPTQSSYERGHEISDH